LSNAIQPSRRRFLGTAAVTMAAAQFGLAAWGKIQTPTLRLPTEGTLPSLGGATEWLNSRPLTAAGLRGKVVLVDFWTYTCINWRRTLPYVRGWAEKYRDQGLVVIGVHTPEFTFEHNAVNVRWAAKDMRIDYPISLDSEYAIWRAFENEYWPALYLVDTQGHIRYHKFGEGDYDRSELVIQQLLSEVGATGFDNRPLSVAAAGLEVAADWVNLQSSENYTGYARTENFASPGGSAHNTPHVYTFSQTLKLNHWMLNGDWTVGKEAVALKAPGGRMACEFHARDLHVVMAARQDAVRFRVFIDGQPPGNARGTDLDEQGNGVVVEPRLYQLLRQSGPISDRRFEIEFLDAGVEAFDFTFG